MQAIDGENICIYGSGSDSIDPRYADAVFDLGARLGREGFSLVFGGGDRGLMAAAASGFVSAGAAVTGIVPKALRGEGHGFEPMTLIETSTISRRKELMVESSLALVAAPGGIGTLDELFDIVSSNIINETRKPVYLFNVDGFYDKLLAILDELHECGFIVQPRSEYLHVYADSAALAEAITRQIRG